MDTQQQTIAEVIDQNDINYADTVKVLFGIPSLKSDFFTLGKKPK